MEPFQRIVLDLWREACRHIEISESTANVAPLLAKQMPIECIVVRRLDLPGAALRTVAIGGPQHTSDVPLADTRCTAAEMNQLLTWAGSGQVLTRAGRAKPTRELELLVPAQLEGDVLVAALTGQGGPAGVLVLSAPHGKHFDEKHVEMLRALVEPFSVALENDRRLHEIAALREAAEADRRSLLNRLGRTDISDTVVGAEAGLKPVMQRVELVSRSDAPVLILGETGTGKELVGRAIHTRSPRSPQPFIRVNCGAIPPDLIDSQLFGHERGSFTGAAEMRQGWFERADGGTLFLDEIGELPLAAQVRLLRVLQDGYIERVGGQQPLRVDVRIVTATHRDLAAMVREGQFREDLWYRIAVFPILLPPLRERVGDIPALARHFAERAATRFGLPVAMPSAEDIHALVGYHWPGNIRELGAVIDRAAILGEGVRLEVVKALGVPPEVESISPRAAAPVAYAPAISPLATGHTTARAPGQAIVSLDEAMRQHIELALTTTGGRIEGRNGAAAKLKINPHTLRARMRKLNVDWKKFREEDMS